MDQGAMTTRKRNAYLEVDASDEEDVSGHDSEAAQESKGGRTTAAATRSSKRRRLDIGDSDGSSSEDIDDLEKPSPTAEIEAPRTSPSQEDHSTAPLEAPARLKLTDKLLPSKPLTIPKDESHKRGVIYLSRIPPFMRPSTVRHLLSAYGTITQLFLTPEPPASYTSRKKSGGNKKRSFIDGWIEFSRRRDAKICVEAINGQIVGGKKGGWYRDDVWNAKYLKGFGWEDLMESVRREEREREEKIRVGVRREGKDRREFLRGMERGMVEAG